MTRPINIRHLIGVFLILDGLRPVGLSIDVPSIFVWNPGETPGFWPMSFSFTVESPDYLKVTIVPFQVPTSTWVSILMDCIKWWKMMEYMMEYIYILCIYIYRTHGENWRHLPQVLDIPSDCIGYVTGSRRAALGGMEDLSGLTVLSPSCWDLEPSWACEGWT